MKKAVDKRGMIWYIKQAVSGDGAMDGELKKVSKKSKKGLDKASEFW